jgi:ABC-2 type transport system ATP-binding protein
VSGPALILDGVTRRFGRVVALDDVTLRAEPGEVLGLVGRNGAGKTTLLRLAAGILWPDAGTIRTLGLDPVAEGIRVRERASILSEESALYPWMTVGEILAFAARLHPRWDPALADDTLRGLRLDPSARVGTLSRGTRAKVALALAVAPRPDLLLLDDPTAGLDPLVRREVLEGILDAVAEGGGAVVYASHLVHDVERVADRVAVLDGGKLVLEGSVDQLKGRIRRARAVFDVDPPGHAPLAGAIHSRVEGRLLTVVADAPDGSLEASLRALGARTVEVETLPLEEILVSLLRRGSEENAHA